MRARTLLGVLAASLLLAGEARATDITFSSTRTEAQGCPAIWHTFTNELVIFVSADLGDNVLISSGDTIGGFDLPIEITGTFHGPLGPITEPVLTIGGPIVASGGSLGFGNNSYTGSIPVTQTSGFPVGSSILAIIHLGATAGSTPAYPDQCMTVSGTLVEPQGFVPPPIPEPATLSLLSLGALGILARRRHPFPRSHRACVSPFSSAP